ncbi:hypothetical protein HYV21_00665 [Candidatus Microgenomates bacterium]|nr:hypothetical protein [Candidatus Microgenomates bacterium]
MSKLFYDHLIIFEEVEEAIRNEELEPEEREELHQLIDEMLHHRVLGCILDHLPREHHEEFLERFHETPYDEGLIVYLQEKTLKDLDIEEKIKEAVEQLKQELLLELKKKK